MTKFKQKSFIEGEIIDREMAKKDFNKAIQLLVLATISTIIITSFFYVL